MRNSEVLKCHLDLSKLRKLSVNYWFKEFFGDSRKSYLELFRAKSHKLVSLIRKWTLAHKTQTGPPEHEFSDLVARVERFCMLCLVRFFVSLVEFISIKSQKKELISELESMQTQMAQTSNQLGLLSKEITFLRENLQMLRSE